MTSLQSQLSASSSLQTPSRRLVSKASLPSLRSPAPRMPVPISATAPSSPMIGSRDQMQPSSETPGKSRVPSVAAPKSRAGSSRRAPTLGSRMIRTFSSQQAPIEMGHSRSGFNPASSKFFVVAIPPPDLPSEPSHPRAPPSVAGQSAVRRGSLLPLYPTLGGQLYAIAREHGLPSIGGMALFLCDDGEGNLGPRIGEDTWIALWSRYFEEPGIEESYDDRYRQQRSPRLRRPSAGSSASPRLHRDIEADASLSTTESDENRSAPRSASRNQSSAFGTSPRSPYTSREGGGTGSRSSGSQAFGRLPIVARLEWTVDKHRAPWWLAWTAEAEMSSSMSVRSVGSRAPPVSTAGRRSLHLTQQSSLSLNRAPPSWTMGSPGVLRTTRAGSLSGPAREPIEMARLATMPPISGISTPPSDDHHHHMKRHTMSSGVGETSQSISGSEDQIAPRSSAVSEVSLSAPGGSTSPEVIDSERGKADDLGGYAQLEDEDAHDSDNKVVPSAPQPAVTSEPLPESPLATARAEGAPWPSLATGEDANFLAVSPGGRTERMPSSEGASAEAASYAGYSALLDTEDDDDGDDRHFRSSSTQEPEPKGSQRAISPGSLAGASVAAPADASASNATTKGANGALEEVTLADERQGKTVSVGTAPVPMAFKLMPDDDEGMWRDLQDAEAVDAPSKNSPDDKATPRMLADTPTFDRLSARSLSLHRISRSPDVQGAASPGLSSIGKGSAVQEWIAKTSSTERISRLSQVLGPTSFDDDFAPSISESKGAPDAESESGLGDDGEPLLPAEDDIGDVMKLWAAKSAAGQGTTTLEPPSVPHEASLTTMRTVTEEADGDKKAPAEAAAVMRAAKLALLSPIALDGAVTSGAFGGPKPQLGDLIKDRQPAEAAATSTVERPPVPAPKTSTGSSSSLDMAPTGAHFASPRLGDNLSSPLLHPASSPSLQPPSPHSPGAHSMRSSSTDLSDTLMDMERALELLSPSASQAGNSPAPGSTFDIGPSPLEFRKSATPVILGTPSPRLLRPREGPNPIQRAAFRASTSAQQGPRSSLMETVKASPRPASTGAVPAGISRRLSGSQIPSTASALAAQTQEEEENSLDATPKAVARSAVVQGVLEEEPEKEQALVAIVGSDSHREAAVLPAEGTPELVTTGHDRGPAIEGPTLLSSPEHGERSEPFFDMQAPSKAHSVDIDGEATEKGIGSSNTGSPGSATAHLVSDAEADAAGKRSSLHSERGEVDFWKPQTIQEEHDREREHEHGADHGAQTSSVRGISDREITPRPRSQAQFSDADIHASPRPASERSIQSTYSTQLQDRFTQTVSSNSADDLSGFIIEPRPRDSTNSSALAYNGASLENAEDPFSGLHSRNDSVQTAASAQTDVPPSVRRMIRGQSFAESSTDPSPAHNSPAELVITDPFSQPRAAPAPPADEMEPVESEPVSTVVPVAPLEEPVTIVDQSEPSSTIEDRATSADANAPAVADADSSDEEWSQEGSDYDDDDATQAASRQSRRSHLSAGSHYFREQGASSNAAGTPTFLYDQHLTDDSRSSSHLPNGRSPVGTPGSRQPSPNPAGKPSPAIGAPSVDASDATALGITLTDGTAGSVDAEEQRTIHAAPQPRPANYGTDMQALATSDGRTSATTATTIGQPSPRPGTSMDDDFDGESEFEHRLDAMLDNIEGIEERGFPGTSAAMTSNNPLIAKTLVTEPDPFARQADVTADDELWAMHQSTSSAVRSALTAHDDSVAPSASAVLSDVGNLGGIPREPRRSLSGDGAPTSPLSKPSSLRRGSGSSTASGRRHRSPTPAPELRRGSNGSAHGRASPAVPATALPTWTSASPRARFKALPPSPALAPYYGPSGSSPSVISPISSPTSFGGAGNSAMYVRRGSAASGGGASSNSATGPGPMAMPSNSATHPTAYASGVPQGSSIYATTPPSRQGTPSRAFHVGSPSTAMVQPLGAPPNASLADLA